MKTIKPLIEKARRSSEVLETLDVTVMNAVLHDMADSLIEHQEIIIGLNNQDVKNGNAMLLSSLAMDQLLLNSDRLSELTLAIRKLANNTKALDIYDENNEKVFSPSLLSIVYESRPHITAEASCVAFRSGNAIILRGGKEAFHTNTAIASILCDVLEQNGLPRELITLIPTTDRVSMTELIGLKGMIDYVTPRGSEGLMQYIQKNSKIPIIPRLPEFNK